MTPETEAKVEQIKADANKAMNDIAAKAAVDVAAAIAADKPDAQ